MDSLIKCPQGLRVFATCRGSKKRVKMCERIKNPKSTPTMYSGVHHTYGVSVFAPQEGLEELGLKLWPRWASDWAPVSVHVTRGKSTGTPFSGLAPLSGAKTPRP